MNQPSIKQILIKTYLKLLMPIIVLLFILYLSQILNVWGSTHIEAKRLIYVLFFILAGVFSLALPVFYRALFVSKLKDRKIIPLEEFLGFEKKLIIISMISPYIIIIPIIFNFPSFYFAGIILFSLYSIYYYYPSEKRIEFEKKLFRIKEEIK
jgi:hypothetical protein